MMRRFIRHPTDIPIDYRVSTAGCCEGSRVTDVGLGGLCFIADRPFAKGMAIHIHIPLDFSLDGLSKTEDDNNFDGDGLVAWCRKEEQGYAVGVQFEDSTTQFGVRMVEQVCHIERYRYDVLEYEGRELNREEAAKEWVERFAAEFPSVC